MEKLLEILHSSFEYFTKKQLILLLAISTLGSVVMFRTFNDQINQAYNYRKQRDLAQSDLDSEKLRSDSLELQLRSQRRLLESEPFERYGMEKREFCIMLDFWKQLKLEHVHPFQGKVYHQVVSMNTKFTGELTHKETERLSKYHQQCESYLKQLREQLTPVKGRGSIIAPSLPNPADRSP